MSKKWVPVGFVLSLLLSSNGIAKSSYFVCEGVTSGSTISPEAKRFDITVSTSPPNLIGPLGPLSFCALTLDKSIRVKSSCSLTDTELKCSCEGGDFIISSTHRFSRLSGDLTFISVTNDDVYRGRYKCSAVHKKIF